MAVCQAYTGSGGWPLNIFMTWDKKPFFAGTYFPPYAHYGMPGFINLLETVKEQWSNNREGLLKSAGQITKQLIIQKNTSTEDIYSNAEDISSIADMAFHIFSETFDSETGGFGSAPKFPSAHNLLFLILYSIQNNNRTAFEMASRTLVQMRKGGIFDHIGYGFSRYSTDRYFLVPHFEKMLYDNAMLIMAYSAAYSVSKEEVFLDTAVKTADYVLREMVSGRGGFYSAQDADSEGVEGKFYVWSLDEIREILGKEKGDAFAEVFGITAYGNFEGMNIPNLLKSGIINNAYAGEIEKLYNYRRKRAKLHLDNKHLASWNSLMAAALSMLYRASGIKKYLDAAIKAVKFIDENLYKSNKLYTSFCNGKCSGSSFLDSYVFYTTALIEIYNSTLDKSFLDKACYFCDETVKRFADNASGGYFLSEPANNELFINPKEIYDGALPCGNSVLAYNFARLYRLAKKDSYKILAEKQLAFMMSNAKDYPAGYSMSLIAGMIYENPPVHITVVLENNTDKNFISGNSIKQKIPFLADINVVEAGGEYSLLNNKTTYYVCKNHACLPPSNEIL